MACMFASSTFAIKLMEPITSAVLQYFILATPLSPVAILSLPVIVSGAIMFSGNPLIQSNLPFGIGAAFMSNIVLAFRNIALKSRMLNEDRPGLTLRNLRCSVLTFAATCASGAGLAWSQNFLSDHGLSTSATCVLSGIFHVVYSYVSTGIVLSHLSVVSHAVTNILKRVLVVLLLYITGSRSASPVNFLGLGVCTLGLMVYAWTKREQKAPTTNLQDSHHRMQRIEISALSKYFVLVTCSFFGGLCLGIMRDSTISMTDNSMFSGPIAEINSVPTTPDGHHSTQWKKAPFEDAETTNFDVATSAQIDDPLVEWTFTHRANDLPKRNYLLPDFDGYLSKHKHSIKEFLQADLISNPNRSSFLSSKLRTHLEVVKEAQRLHFDVIGKALKTYKYAMLFDLAAFENKGDPCISVGEIYFLARIKLKLLYYCAANTCKKENFIRAEKQARKYSFKDLVILVHGGGNIVGYKFSDNQRFTIFKIFKGYQIFVFPQSVYIRDFNSIHFELCKKNYCCNENVTFVMRDHQSYKYAKQYFSGTTKFIVAPDMAFQIGPMPRFLSPVFDIMWIKRSDHETPNYTEIPVAPQGVRVHVSDWWDWRTPKAPNSLEQAYYTCTNGFFYLQRGRVIITDRLHGHILATLLNIPHVLIDNKQHKLSAYHLSWTAGLQNVYITDDPVIAIDLALKLLAKNSNSLPPRVPFLHINEASGKDNMFAKPDQSYP
ncbi:hypothetical protein RRG08_035505 [Elysia crispata]|uniref:Polysaccharide pyruvyl transferase domain-containing protein n=1 Tax=Elysia crispata TaxID=231223 RepID=A0AAE1A657_9GAST|nr:hypothetical protein RRG08_035505 [Elysia crispata]